MANFIEKPFFYQWGTGPLDERPLGSGEWLPYMAIAYFVSLTALKPLAGASWLQKPLKYFAVVNNAFMCLYSTWAFVVIATVLARNWSNSGYAITPFFCDTQREMLKSMDYQMYIFYVSKYWEWIDTYILVLKGKPVWPPANSQFFLHIFHHATTATVGWLAWRQELTVAWVGPLTNSFVHMLMYGYYTLVTIMPSAQKFGIYITPVQIFQFMLCLASFAPEAVDSVLFGGASCGATKRCSAWMLFAYLTYLGFFVKMFADKKAARRAAKKAKAEGGGKAPATVSVTPGQKEMLKKD